MSATTGEIRFNPFDPEFVASPYEQYAILRDEDPVHWSDLLWGWVVTRHDDVATVDQVVDTLVEHPALLQRPLLVTDDTAFIGRPKDRVTAAFEG